MSNHSQVMQDQKQSLKFTQFLEKGIIKTRISRLKKNNHYKHTNRLLFLLMLISRAQAYYKKKLNVILQ